MCLVLSILQSIVSSLYIMQHSGFSIVDTVYRKVYTLRNSVNSIKDNAYRICGVCVKCTTM